MILEHAMFVVDDPHIEEVGSHSSLRLNDIVAAVRQYDVTQTRDIHTFSRSLVVG